MGFFFLRFGFRVDIIQPRGCFKWVKVGISFVFHDVEIVYEFFQIFWSLAH